MTDEERERQGRKAMTLDQRNEEAMLARLRGSAEVTQYDRIKAAKTIERLTNERDIWRKKAEDKDNEIVMALGGREHPSRRQMTDEEQHKLNAAWRSTPLMRARIRELSRPNSDDYDKAVIAVLDDFEAVLTQSACEPAESKSMTKTVTDAMVNAAYEAYWDAPDDVEDHASMRIALEAALAQSDAESAAFNKTERKLLPGLRRAAYILQQYWEPAAIVPAFDDVQNEIKRIEANPAALAQSDAEPVAWRYRIKGMSTWWVAPKDDRTLDYWRASNYEVEPLYTAPPRSDAFAGLIEAAEWLEQREPACYSATTAREWATELRREVAVRARAADRSWK